MSMKRKSLIVLMLMMVGVIGASSAQDITANGRLVQPLVQVEVINMSGKSREAHVRNAVVRLPIAERVVLQVPQGQSITITSDTDRRVARIIRPASTDAGRTIPIS